MRWLEESQEHLDFEAGPPKGNIFDGKVPVSLSTGARKHSETPHHSGSETGSLWTVMRVRFVGYGPAL